MCKSAHAFISGSFHCNGSSVPRNAGWFASGGQHLASGLFVPLVLAHMTPPGEASPWRRAMFCLWQALPGLFLPQTFFREGAV